MNFIVLAWQVFCYSSVLFLFLKCQILCILLYRDFIFKNKGIYPITNFIGDY